MNKNTSSNFHQNNKPKKHKQKHLSNFHLDNMLKKFLFRQYA